MLRLSHSTHEKPQADHAQGVLGQPGGAALAFLKEDSFQRRQTLSCLLFLSSCIIWVMALSAAGVGPDGTPWYMAIAGSVVYFSRYLQGQQDEYDIFRLGAREPIQFRESLALTYFVSALALYLWVSHKPQMLDRHAHDRLVQVVDIQLTSTRDFADRQSPLPGTQIKAPMRKRIADRISRQQDSNDSRVSASIGSRVTTSPKTQPATRGSEPLQPKPPAIPTSKLTLPVVFMADKSELAASPGGMAPHAVALPKTTPQRSLQKANQGKELMQEVKVSDLVELVENDGQQDQSAVYAAGGHSLGGKGANNDLSDYLKELHRRIKHAWSPPRGQSRTARLLFRLKKESGLDFIKVLASSGDSDTDLAAIHAVSAAADRKLPDAFTEPFLDVQYTFNYNADQLQEVPPSTE